MDGIMDGPNSPHELSSTAASYMNRLLAYRQSDVDRDNMVQDLIRRYEILERQYYEKVDDYNNEVESRRMWQNKASNATKALSTLKQSSETAPFVYAIIDGDGAVFHETLLKKGAEGGAEAAYRLQSQIKEYIKENYPETSIEDWSIVVQIVLNLDGLAKKLHAAGIIPNTTENPTLAAFGRGFGRSQPLFSFVDVGSGKESADHKIRELLRLMVRVNQCKHIFFGPCHDKGYLPFLEPYKRDVKVAPRLTLLEATPAEHGFHDLGFKIVNFPNVFKTEPLPARPSFPSMSSMGQSLPNMMPPPPLPSSAAAKVPPPRIQNAAAASVISPPPETRKTMPSPSPSTSSLTPSSSWSNVSKTGAASNVIDLGVKKKPTVRKYYLLNAESERVDEPLPRSDPAAEKKFKDLMHSNGTNFCNSFYLQGGCESPTCNYYHGEKLPSALLLILKHKVRGIMCSDESWCTDSNCIFGHHCKWAHDCTLNWCRFAKTHNMDTTPRLRVFDDGTTQTLVDKKQ